MKTKSKLFLVIFWAVLGLQTNVAQIPWDAGVTQILSVPILTSEGQITPVGVVVQNFGTDTIHFMSIAYQLNNGMPVMVTWSGILPPLMTDTVVMPSFVSPAGNSVICARTILMGDSNFVNDESCFLFFGIPQNDAAGIKVIGPNSGCGLGVDSVTIWIKNYGVNTINHPVSSGGTVSYRLEGQTTIVTEPFTKVLYPGDSTWHRFSTPVNFGVTTQTDTFRIVAWINLPGDNVSYNDTAFIEVISVHTPSAPFVYDTIVPYGTTVTLPAVSPDLVSWYPSNVSTVPLHQGSTYTTPILYTNTTYWVEAVAGLPGGPSYPQGCPGSRVPLNVVVLGPPACDAGVLHIWNSLTFVPAGNQLPVYITFRNHGSDTIFAGSLSLSYRLNNGAPVTITYPSSLLPGTLDSIVMPPVTIPAGTNTLCAYTTLACDFNPINDTVCITITGVATYSIPFTENFDSTNTFYTDSTSIWQHGAPNGTLINTAFSSPNAWVTNLNGNYPNNATSFLYSPTYNFQSLGAADTVILTIRHYCAMQPGDYGRVQYTINGGQNWSTLGFYLDPSGSNWYNTTSGGLHYFSQTNSGWMQSSYKLSPSVFNGSTQVQFRFHFYSNASGVSEGWAIDNFSLSLINSAVHAGVTNITFPVNDTTAGVALNATITITNFTSQPLGIVPVQLRLNGVVVTMETFAGFLPGNQSVNFTFVIPYTVPFGQYTLCARTQIAGAIQTNTEYCRTLNGLGNPTGYVYGLLSTGMGAAGPSEVYLIQHDPVSGTLTALDTTLSVDSVGVTTYYFSAVPPGSYLVKGALLPSNPNYANNIPTYYLSSLFWNQAAPVQVLPNGFTQASITYVQGINPGGPGFVGGLVTQGANKGPGDPLEGVQIILLDAGNNDQPVAVDFSDASGKFSFSNIPVGVYKVYAEVLNKVTIPAIVVLDPNNPVIDNINIVVGSSVIYSVWDKESTANFMYGTPYPNPVEDLLTIPVNLINPMVIKAEITDLTGRIVHSHEVSLLPGQQMMQINVSEMANGLYLCTLFTSEGHRKTEKIIKK